MWQDLVFGSSNILFSLFLYPTIMNKNSKMPFITSVLTSVMLMINSLTFYSLNLLFPCFSGIIASGIWLFIAFKRRL